MTIGTVSFAAVPLQVPGLPTSEARASERQAAAAAEHFGRAAPGVVRDIEAAATRLMSDASTANLIAASDGDALPAGAPELRGPDMALVHTALGDEEAARRMTPEALFMALVGELMETIVKSDAESLKARAQIAMDAMAQQQAAYERVLESASGAQATLDADLQAATEAGEEAQRRVTLATEGSDRVDRLQAQLDALSPDDPEHARVAAELEGARRELQSLRSDAAKASQKLLEATDKVSASQQEVNRFLAEAEEIRKTVLPGLAVPEQKTTNSAELTKLMAVLSTVMTNAQRAKVEFEAGIAIEKLKQQQAENTRRAEEHQKKIEHAEQISKHASCAAKIALWIGTAFMTVMGVVTGGATLAIAAVFLSMLIVNETTGVDIVGKVVNPIVEEVVKPIADFVGGLITKMLLKLGYDEEYAKKVGMIAGMVYAMAAMIGTAIAGVAIFKAIAGKVIAAIGPIVAKFAAKMLGSVLAVMAKVIAKAAAVSAKLVIPKAAMYAAKAQLVASVASLAAQAGTSGAHIAADVERLDAARLMADVMLGIQQSEVIQEHMRRMHEESARIGDFVDALLERMSDIGRNTSNASAAVIANLNFRTA